MDRMLPSPLFRSTSGSSTIGALLSLRDDPLENWEAQGIPSVLGYRIPPFQRPLVWEEDRMVSFVESAILGLHLGTFAYNSWPDGSRRVNGEIVWPETHMWLIDGQQRLTALDRYFSDAFPVFGYRWSELSKPDQRDVRGRRFEGSELRSDDPAFLRVVYDRLNFGGVAHTNDQRASNDDEIEAVMTPRR